MSNTSNLSSILRRLSNLKKAASNGFNSSMPDDPTGNGTTDYKTGPQYDQYAKDLDAIETVPPNADSAPVHSMTEDLEQENSLSSYTLSTSGSEEQSAEGEYEDRPEDPGTSMPAEAGQEKYSSAESCTLEQNIDVFNKCAQFLWSTKQASANMLQGLASDVGSIDSLPLGYFTKRAMEEGASPDEVNETAAVEALAEEDPEVLEVLSEASPEELAELVDIAEQIESEEGGDAASDEDEAAAVEMLSEEDPEMLSALMEAPSEELIDIADVADKVENPEESLADDTIDKEAAYWYTKIAEEEGIDDTASVADTEVEAETTPEEDAALEQLADENPELLDELLSAPIEDLADIADDGDMAVAAEDAADEDDELDAVEALAEEDPELLEMLSDASVDDLVELADAADEIKEASVKMAEENEALAIEELSDSDPELLDSLLSASPEELEELASVVEEIEDGAEADDLVAEDAALQELAESDPELLEAISEASPEDLSDLADVADQIEVSGGELSPEECAALEKQCFFAQGPANQQLLASLTDGQLKQAAENTDLLMKAAASGQLSDYTLNQILSDDDANLTESDYYRLALQKKAEEEAEVFESLDPEYQEALLNASDEELQNIIALGEAAEENPEVLEDILSEEDDEPTSEEALNELASAMEEEGITPELLAEASKQASWDPRQNQAAYSIACKVANYIKSGKHKYGPAKTEKAARARYLSHQYLKEILR